MAIKKGRAKPGSQDKAIGSAKERKNAGKGMSVPPNSKSLLQKKKSPQAIDTAKANIEERASELERTNILLRKEMAEREAVEDQLRRSKERYDLATAVGEIGIWDWNPVTGELVWSDDVYRILGEEKEKTTPSFELFVEHVHDGDKSMLNKAVEEALYNKQPYDLDCRLTKGNEGGRVCHLTGKVTFDSDDKPVRMLGTIKDITKQKQTDEKITANADLLRSITKAQSSVIADSPTHEIFNNILSELLELTDSEYGFIGETFLDNDNGDTYLRVFAWTNISWNEETRALYSQFKDGGAEFRNLKSLYGALLTTGDLVISNDPASDPRSGGIPDGQPPLEAFMGLPIKKDGKLIGMIGVANRAGGYDEELAKYLAPLVKTCSGIITSINNDKLRKHAVELLRESEEKTKAIIATVGEGVVSVCVESIIRFVNHELCNIFGYTRKELIGKKVEMLIPDKYKASHAAGMVQYLEGGKANILGHRLELEGLRKDGSIFPIELRVEGTLLGEGKKRFFTAAIRDITERKNSEKQLRDEKRLFLSGEVVIFKWKNCDGWPVEYVSSNVENAFGYTAEEFTSGRISYAELINVEDVQRVVDEVTLNSESGVSDFTHEDYRIIRKDGESIWLYDHTVILRDDGGNITHYLGYVFDVTERKQAEEKLKLSAMVFSNASEGVMVTDVNGVIEYTNPSFTAITGYSAKEAIGENPNILKSNRHSKEFYKEMWLSLIKNGKWQGEVWNQRKNGEPYIVRQSINAIKDSDGNTIQYASIFQDITEIKHSAEEVEYHAYHDLLTGLPNRSLFIDRLKQVIGRASRDRQNFALLFIDIDDFKKVNDNFGHDVGDLLIKGVGMRLSTCVRDTDTVARYAGDEFIIITENIKSDQSVAAIAEKIIESVSEPYLTHGGKFISTVSIGIAIYPGDGDSVEELVKNADFAMYHVKEQNKNNYSFFTKELNEEASNRFALEHSMREALEKNEFIVYYQPKVMLSSGYSMSLEALVRWEYDGEIISPAAFIPLAEETGLVVQIGEFVLRSACKQVKAWQDMGHDKLSVSVNISARQMDKGNLLNVVQSALDESGLKAKYLCLEVTETAIMKNMDIALKTLEQIKKIGVMISLDDFGTGYSSLSHIRRFPIDEIKIDRFFIVSIPEDKKDSAIATTIIAMAKNLNLTVVAEGVETQAQLDFLNEAGCNEIQGYLFSHPVGPEKMENLLNEKWKR